MRQLFHDSSTQANKLRSKYKLSLYWRVAIMQETAQCECSVSVSPIPRLSPVERQGTKWPLFPASENWISCQGSELTLCSCICLHFSYCSMPRYLHVPIYLFFSLDNWHYWKGGGHIHNNGTGYRFCLKTIVFFGLHRHRNLGLSAVCVSCLLYGRPAD